MHPKIYLVKLMVYDCILFIIEKPNNAQTCYIKPRLIRFFALPLF